MKKSRAQVWSIVGVMFVVTLVSAILLTYVYNLTKQPIKEAQNRIIAESINSVITTEFDNNPFAEKIIVKSGRERYALYPARKDGYVTSIVMKSFSNKGFGGRMDVIVGFMLDGTISGYRVINHKETPGLGSKVNDNSFSKNIIGHSPSLKSFNVKQDGGDVDAITGATISSRALIDAIQKAYRGYVKFNTGN